MNNFEGCVTFESMNTQRWQNMFDSSKNAGYIIEVFAITRLILAKVLQMFAWLFRVVCDAAGATDAIDVDSLVLVIDLKTVCTIFDAVHIHTDFEWELEHYIKRNAMWKNFGLVFSFVDFSSSWIFFHFCFCLTRKT